MNDAVLSDAETERDLAPLIAEAKKRDPRYRLGIAIADWKTLEGLDALREQLVRRQIFDTEALRVIAHRRERITEQIGRAK